MKYILNKEDVDLLIKQLRKYYRSRDGDHYTIAIHIAQNAVVKCPKAYISGVKLLGIVEGALFFKANNETIYEILKLLGIEVEE